MLKRNLKLLSALVVAVPLLLNTGVVAAHAANSYKDTTSNTRGAFNKPDFRGDFGKGNGQNEGFKTKLDTLVTAGTITEAQETAVLNLFTPSTNNGTDGNSQTKPGNPKDDFKTKLDTLVTAGTITEAQETSVLNLFTQPSNNNTARNSQGKQEKPIDDFKTKLDGLVTAGTITQDQETAILNVLKPSGNVNVGQGDTSSTTIITGTAAYTQSRGTVTKSSQTITASDTDESGVKITDSGTFALSDSMITTTGSSSSEDNSNFYGLNAGVLAESGSNITLSNTTINTSGSGANAVFATGSGSSVTLSDVTINTSADSSRGLDATLTGTINATNVNITTAGTHCAALATDRGQGAVNATGGTMTTNGVDSPGIYSTGNITVSDAKITANGSEAAVVEGKNSISLTNTILSGAKKRGVMMYQSFSGDAEVGTSSFTMNGGSLSAAEGPLFYATNTDTVIELKGVDATAASGTLLTASADSWGTTGSNGATVNFKADSQTLTGNITCDSICSITATLQNSSILKGSINTDNTAKSMALTLDSTSKWIVTGTSYLTSLTDADTTLANIDDNGFNIYYDSSSSANSWLKGSTYTLTDGGKLIPISK